MLQIYKWMVKNPIWLAAPDTSSYFPLKYTYSFFFLNEAQYNLFKKKKRMLARIWEKFFYNTNSKVNPLTKTIDD